MLLFVDDRFSSNDIHEIERFLINSSEKTVIGRAFSLSEFSRRVNVIDGDYHIVPEDKDGKVEVIEGTDSQGILSIITDDPDDIVLLSYRRLYFQDKLEDILRSHREGGADVTVLVKELAALPGMIPVFLDNDMNISYQRRDDPVRSKTMDLNYYLISKNIVLDILKNGGHIKDFDPRTFPIIQNGSKMNGYRLRSKLGFVQDLHSILETQRMVMDGHTTEIENETMRNVDLRDDQILNMPIYVGDNVVIGGQCRLGPYASIMSDVRIGKNVYIINSIIGNDCTLEDDIYLEGVILGPGKHLEKGTEIEWEMMV
jgi:NDP-sugar pyrophosphorylase family protein